jgi:hypothetical protein
MVKASKTGPKPRGDKDKVQTDRKNKTDDELAENTAQIPNQRQTKVQAGA